MKTIYTNGTIVTLEDMSGDSLVEENGKIIAIDNYHKIYQKDMKIVDLQGKTLIPAFIDSHSHISGYASAFLQVSLDNCQSIVDVQQQIEKYIQENNIKDHQWIMCKGYDQHRLIEKRHITKLELDEVSKQHPIVVQHQTGHCGIMNSLALEILGIEKTTKSPAGGQINYQEGFLEENAFALYLQKVPMPSLDLLKNAYLHAQQEYARFGITTVQDGMLVKPLLPIYKALLKDKIFYLDIVGYPGFDVPEYMQELKEHVKQYKDHFKIGGYKMFLDGSPQNKTAWVIDPYTDGSYGYPTLTDQQIQDNLKKAIDEDIQVLAHCNGDQAISHYMNQYQIVKKQDIRPVIIHAQMMRPSQMNQVKELAMLPSFFLSHVYYFGDIHKENMGVQRAQYISPLHSALEHDLRFTLHTDVPVIQPNMIESLHIAVNRKTKKGDILGQNECIQPIDALKALTINGAYQYHEEKQKGSLKVGKNADMVILSDNPLTIDKKHIKDIKVLKTIKDGITVYEG